jgi:xanthine dehydrogenase accessory factor
LAQVDIALWGRLQEFLAQNQGCVLLTPLSDSTTPHLLFKANEAGQASNELAQIAQKAYQERKSQVLEHQGVTYFLGVYPPKLQLFVVGAAHAAAELVHLAKYFDFEVIVMDPRGTFAQNTQFTTAPDQLLEEYPAEVLPEYQLDEYSFAVVMAHDPKIDDQALYLLLRSKVAYIGALSSKASNEKRKQRLLEAGFTEQEIQCIHAPVGLPIKSKTAKEIALSIMAQIVAVKNQYL